MKIHSAIALTTILAMTISQAVYSAPFTESELLLADATNCKVSIDGGADFDVATIDVIPFSGAEGAGGKRCYPDLSSYAGTGSHEITLRVCNIWGCQTIAGVPLSFGTDLPGVSQFIGLVSVVP